MIKAQDLDIEVYPVLDSLKSKNEWKCLAENQEIHYAELGN